MARINGPFFFNLSLHVENADAIFYDKNRGSSIEDGHGGDHRG